MLQQIGIIVLSRERGLITTTSNKLPHITKNYITRWD
jgi:hypothetical protein